MFRLDSPVGLLALLVAVPAVAQPAKPKLTAAEEKTVAHCLALIRNCQLPDGAFNMMDEGNAPAAPVWVAPYFVNHAVLALLAGHAAKPDRAAVAAVGKWIEWSAKHQDKGGFWLDQTGTRAGYKSNGHVDAHDSSAALFLLVLERYQRAGGKPTEKALAAALAALKCIENVTDQDGLTWAKPDYKVKYLMDNVEVYAGLRAAEKLLAATHPKAAKAAGERADAAGKGLKTYWEAKDKGRFAWALHRSGQYDGGLEKSYPHGLAQLFGVAFVAAEAAPFAAVVKAFPPGTEKEANGAERYAVAAARLGGKDAADWRAAVVKDAGGFKPTGVYIFRPAVAALALLEGADWMPSLAK